MIDIFLCTSENQGEKNEGFVWKVVMELASALNYCHHGLRIRTPESGNAIDWDDTMIILHRDIKPGNGA